MSEMHVNEQGSEKFGAQAWPHSTPILNEEQPPKKAHGKPNKTKNKPPE